MLLAERSRAELARWRAGMNLGRELAAGVAKPNGRGEANGRAKLTAAAVRAIRAAVGRTPAELGRHYGVDPRAIRKILAGETWQRVR